MRILQLTLPTPTENLALDEALLEEAEAAAQPLETLRLWEPMQNMAVVGRSSHLDVETNRDFCRALGIPILRRVSGGATILTGPGCMMYALVLSYQNRPNLRAISQAHGFVLDTLAKAIGQVYIAGQASSSTLAPSVRICGTSDLAIGDQKFSGNSMRARRNHFLYHGTILYNFPLDLISRCLKTPPRMPDYRNGRDHRVFLANLPVPAAAIRQAMISAFDAVEPLENWPRELTAKLAAEKYNHPQWNECF